MKLFPVLSTLLVGAFARPSGLLTPVAYALIPAPLTAPISSQYHAQDELGQYTYGYASGLAAKTETRTADGITRGGYSYVDAEGKLQSVEYTSDALNGFRVSASNLPVAPAVPTLLDTPEVLEAKTQHLVAIQEAAARAAAAPEEEPPRPTEPVPPPAPTEAPSAPPAEEVSVKAAAPSALPSAVTPGAVPAAVAPAAYPYLLPVASVSAFSTYTAPLTAYSYSVPLHPGLVAYAAPVAFAPVAPLPAVTKAAAETKAEETKSD